MSHLFPAMVNTSINISTFNMKTYGLITLMLLKRFVRKAEEEEMWREKVNNRERWEK